MSVCVIFCLSVSLCLSLLSFVSLSFYVSLCYLLSLCVINLLSLCVIFCLSVLFFVFFCIMNYWILNSELQQPLSAHCHCGSQQRRCRSCRPRRSLCGWLQKERLLCCVHFLDGHRDEGRVRIRHSAKTHCRQLRNKPSDSRHSTSWRWKSHPEGNQKRHKDRQTDGWTDRQTWTNLTWPHFALSNLS